MSSLTFRLVSSDWASTSFDAQSAEELSRGVRTRWEERIAQHPRVTTHPRLALQARLSEIDRWLSERNPGATAEQRKSWTAQAEYWRFQANRDLGGAGGLLELQVKSRVGDYWLVTSKYSTGIRPPRIVDLEITHLWLTNAAKWVDHDQNISGVIDRICDIVSDAMAKERRERLHVV